MPWVFKWRGRTENHFSFFFPYTGPISVGQQGRRLGPVGRAELAEPTPNRLFGLGWEP